MEQQQMEQMGGKKLAVGPAIGLVVILAVIVLGGYYFLSSRSTSDTYSFDQNSATNTAAVENGDSNLKSIQQQGSGYDTTSIKADLDATNFNRIDSDAQTIQ